MPLGQISFHSPVLVTALQHRKQLKVFLLRLFKLERTPISRVDFVFCDDEYLLNINKEWLNHDYFTDTVSFLLSEPGAPVVGEVYISIDRVRENALAFGVPLAEELHRVIFHSCLHLCGYEDNNPALKTRMRIKEDKYLKSYSSL